VVSPGALPWTVIFLDLHGAMVAEHEDDGEGALIAVCAAARRPRCAHRSGA